MLAIIMWPLSGSWGVVACCVTHIWRTTFLFSWCWMSLFLLCVSTSWPMQTNKSSGDNKTKQRNWKCHQLWLDFWTEMETWQTKQMHWQKGERFRQWETLNKFFSTCFTYCTCKPTHASRVAHMTVKGKDRTVVFLSASGMERKKKRKKEGEWEQLLVGVDRAAPAPHRRITLERTHHLCSFVELSHFNPQPGSFGNQLYTPT